MRNGAGPRAPTRSFRVACLGRIVLDIIATPIERLPPEEGALRLDHSWVSYGGSAANTAVELASRGIATYLVGATGDDSLSYRLLDILQTRGVNTDSVIHEPGRSTSLSFVSLSAAGVPRYLYSLGPDSGISYEALVGPFRLFELIRSNFISHVHVAGINVLPQLDGKPLVRLFRELRSSCPGVTISVDASKILTTPRINLHALKYVDVVFANHVEASAMAGSSRFADISGILAPRSGRGASLCLIKLGQRGCVACHRDGWMAACPGYRVNPVNLNGAGDVFAAEWLRAMFARCSSVECASAAPVRTACDLANRAAASFVSSAPNITATLPRRLTRRPWYGALDTRRPDTLAFASSRHARRFERLRELPQPVMRWWIEAIQARFRDATGRSTTILDAGAGSGRFCVPLALALPAARLVACERSRAMLDRLERRAALERCRNVTVIHGDILTRPVTARYDCVFLSEVVHLVEDPRELLGRLCQAIKLGGSIVIRMTAHHQLQRQCWYRYFPSLLPIDLRRHRDVPDVYSILSSSGFTNIEVKEIDEGGLVPIRRYVDTLEQKAYSALHLLDPVEFRGAVQSMKRRLAGRDSVVRVMPMTLLAARRHA